MKKNKKRSLFKYKLIVYLLIIIFATNYTYSYLCKYKLRINNENFLQLLLTEGNHHLLGKLKPKQVINSLFYHLLQIDFQQPITILGINFFDKKKLAANKDFELEPDYSKTEELANLSSYLSEPKSFLEEAPLVYIYNSHQLEQYDPEYLEIYNIRPNVLMASYLLKEKLNDWGIPALVETANIIEFMRINHWSHADSYKASRIYMIDTKNKYDSIKYYIDLHRDSIKKDASTVVINKKKYAKTLFVVGLENPTYQANLEMATRFDRLLKKHYPGLSRGILKKQGSGVNGVYNQDLSPQALLIEVGGIDNNIEEVLNTITAFAHVFYEYVVQYE